MRKKEIKRLRILYYIFFVMILFSVCFVFFSSDLRLVQDEGRINRQMKEKMTTKQSSHFISTYLRHQRKPYGFDIPIGASSDSSMVLSGRINTYDVLVEFNNAPQELSRYFIVSFILLICSNLSMISIMALLIILFFSLRKSINKGKIFAKKDIKIIRIIALLLIGAPVSTSLSIYFEHLQMVSYLKGTDWVPILDFPFSFMEIIFGIVILFLSEFFAIAYQMQEEQELTI